MPSGSALAGEGQQLFRAMEDYLMTCEQQALDERKSLSRWGWGSMAAFPVGFLLEFVVLIRQKNPSPFGVGIWPLGALVAIAGGSYFFNKKGRVYGVKTVKGDSGPMEQAKAYLPCHGAFKVIVAKDRVTFRQKGQHARVNCLLKEGHAAIAAEYSVSSVKSLWQLPILPVLYDTCQYTGPLMDTN